MLVLVQCYSKVRWSMYNINGLNCPYCLYTRYSNSQFNGSKANSYTEGDFLISYDLSLKTLHVHVAMHATITTAFNIVIRGNFFTKLWLPELQLINECLFTFVNAIIMMSI